MRTKPNLTDPGGFGKFQSSRSAAVHVPRAVSSSARPTITATSRALDVIVKFDSDGKLRGGGTVNAEVVTGRKPNAIVVPEHAIVPRPEHNAGDPSKRGCGADQTPRAGAGCGSPVPQAEDQPEPDPDSGSRQRGTAPALPSTGRMPAPSRDGSGHPRHHPHAVPS